MSDDGAAVLPISAAIAAPLISIVRHQNGDESL